MKSCPCAIYINWACGTLGTLLFLSPRTVWRVPVELVALPGQMLAALLYRCFGLGGGPRLPSCTQCRLSQPGSWKIQVVGSSGCWQGSGVR